ncbi:hypothetical protein KC867_02135 [Candidatus Saccharibacteria bacterium]|nr:hypothetical protein [Candidatus Saccharibacteria bacterium]
MLIIAHRGFAHNCQENTLDAIKQAQAIGVDMVEIDIRVTKDKIAILCHDTFIQTDKGKLYINKSTFQELALADNQLTKLEQALAMTKIHYLIEIKPKVDTAPIIEVIQKHRNNNLIIASFDYKVLQDIKQTLPTLPLAVLDKWSGVRASHRARKLQTKTIVINQRWLWSGFIKSVANAGYDLYSYTINDSSKATKWQNQGLAGAITDRPDTLRKLTK